MSETRLSPELLRKIRRIEIRTRRRVQESLAGEYLAVFKGQGIAFDEVRPYQPGDEVRTIDWNVTARSSEPYVKRFIEERELTVMLLVDLSASMRTGSSRQKRELAAEIGAVLAFSASSNQDRVGAILFTDRVEKIIPPKRGRRHILGIIADLLDHPLEGKKTDLGPALQLLHRAVRHRAIVFMISDFANHLLEFEDQKWLSASAKRHDLVAIDIADPLEVEGFPELKTRLARVVDAESGEETWQRFNGSERAAALSLRGKRQQGAEQILRRKGVDQLSIRTDEDYARALARFFIRRSRIRGRG